MADTLKNWMYNVVYNSNNGRIMTITSGSITASTIISFSVCNTHATNDHNFTVIVKENNSAEYYLYKSQSIPAKATFVHNDKLVLNGTDVIEWHLDENSADTLGVVVSYLEQTA